MSGPSPAPANPTVFVVDDDPSFLVAMCRFLRSSGFTVQARTSAAEFLEKLSPEVAGCVITDLHMPGRDGFDLQAALAQSPNPLPIIFLTGQGEIPESVRAMRSGAEDFLIKTDGQERILQAVARALARDRRDREARRTRAADAARFHQLTPRENEVLSHVLRGRMNKEIAAALGVDERSVKRHRTSFMHKLQVPSVAELVQLANRAGRRP